MKVVFLGMEKSKIIIVALFLILFTIFGLTALSLENWTDFLIPVVAIASGIIFFVNYLYIRPTRKAKSLFKNLRINEDNITFPSFLNVETGYFEATGEWRSSGNNRSYYVDRKFIPSKKETKMYLELNRDEFFFMAIDRDGEGIIHFPGIKVLDERFKNTMILYAKPDYSISFSSEKTSVSYENDLAELRVSPAGQGFKGSLHILLKLTKARKAKVEIISKGKVGVKNKILETNVSSKFEHRFPEEIMVVVSPYKALSPRNLLKQLRFNEVIAGYGNFLIRLSLDLPFRRDVKAEMEFTIKPQEKV